VFVAYSLRSKRDVCTSEDEISNHYELKICNLLTAMREHFKIFRIITNQMSKWGKFPLGKLAVSQLSKKFPAFHET